MKLVEGESALGCVAVELLSGRPASEADSFGAAVFAIVHQAPKGLNEIGVSAGGDVAAALKRWLAKSPEDRCQSAEEVLRDLERLRPPPPSAGSSLRRRVG